MIKRMRKRFQPEREKNGAYAKVMTILRFWGNLQIMQGAIYKSRASFVKLWIVLISSESLVFFFLLSFSFRILEFLLLLFHFLNLLLLVFFLIRISNKIRVLFEFDFL